MNKIEVVAETIEYPLPNDFVMKTAVEQVEIMEKMRVQESEKLKLKHPDKDTIIVSYGSKNITLTSVSDKIEAKFILDVRYYPLQETK